MKKRIYLSLVASTLIILSGCGGGSGSSGSGNGNVALKVSAGSDRSVVINAPVRVVGGSNRAGTSYQWSEGSTNISGANSNVLVYTPTSSGVYTLTLTATNGSETKTDTVKLTVSPTAPNYRNLLIVRINFSDTQFQNGSSVWVSKIFGNGSGELNNYYNEVSNGKLQFLPATEYDGVQDGIVDVTLSQNHPADDSSDTSYRFWSLFKSAVSKIDSKIDFSSYDGNSDGTIDAQELQIVFLVSGGETSTGWNPSSSVWGLMSCYSSPTTPSAPTQDGVTLMKCSDGGDFARFGERHKAFGGGSHDATIGIIAHELGHSAFGLPDLYDIDGATGGIGMFGLMGAGSWARATATQKPGQTPVHMTAWSKIQANFATPTILSTATSATFHGADKSNYNIYQVNTGTAGEYYLVENRPNSGYDKGLHSLNNGNTFTGGLLVMHVDENMADNSGNPHRLVDIEEASSPELDNTSGSNRGAVGNLFYGANTGTISAPYSGGTAPSIISVSAPGEPMTATITP